MTLFKLEQFPHVCRLCLRPDLHEEMVPLSSDDVVLEGTISDFIANITFVISKNKSHLFPQKICTECLGMLKYFGKFRTKVMNVHLLMNSLVELKHFNPVPIEDLFRNKREYLHTLFNDLDLCSKSQPEAGDLINEFAEYEIASIASPSREDDEKPPLFSDEESMDLDDSASCASDMSAEEYQPEEASTSQGLHVSKEVKTKPEREKNDNDDENSQEELFLDASNFKDIESVLAIPRKFGGPKSDVPLRCNKCKYATFRHGNFKAHQLTHLKRELSKYLCKEKECGVVFDTAAELRRHRATKHKSLDKPFMCESCGFKTASEKFLLDHKQRHMKLGSYTCQFCQKKCNVKNDLRLHIRQAHLDYYKYECKTCGKKFKQRHILRDHEQTHSDAYDFPCDKCDSKFKTKQKVRTHFEWVHTEPSKLCQYCDAVFRRNGELYDHIERVHGVRVRFICDICVSVFTSQEDLGKHVLRHTSPQELECATCLSVFRSQEEFDGHLCITYRDDYVCCGRDQRHFTRYNDHMFTKHGLRTKVRVKPDPNVLMGEMRAKRKRIESCRKCDIILPTRKAKQDHEKVCVG